MIVSVSESEETSGSLADAIAAHLELKKEHGADPDDVEREKQSALGAARRDAGEPADIVAPPPVPPAGAPEPPPKIPSVVDAPPVLGESTTVPPIAQDATAAAPPSQAAAEPAPASDMGETIEFDWASAGHDDNIEVGGEESPPEPEPLDDDVLEATPEFFEETPEYDKLWFEEKPPKNFDF
jgi:hypothetical protein